MRPSYHYSKIILMADKFLRKKVINGLITKSPSQEDWAPFSTCNDYYPKIIIFNDGSRFQVKSKFDFVNNQQFQNLTLTSMDIVVESPVNGWGVSFEKLIVRLGKKLVFHYKVENPEVVNPNLTDNFYRLADMVSLSKKLTAAEPSKRKYLKESWDY